MRVGLFLTTWALIFGLLGPVPGWTSPVEQFALCLDLGLLRKAQPEDHYRVRYIRGDPNLPLTFGIEAEVSIEENPNIVNDYRPVNVDEHAWLEMPFAERIQAALAWQKKSKGTNRQTPIFQRLANADAHLPQSLFPDGGRIEFNGVVFRTLGDAADFVADFVARYGPGSFQGHVAYPRTATGGGAGYTVLEGDAAQMAALDRGYRSYTKTGSTPAKNLINPSLAPMTTDDLEKLVSLEDRIASGSLGPINGPKTVYAPVTRTLPYDLWDGAGYEFRQFHKRFLEMIDEMNNVSARLESPEGLKRYAPFAGLTLLQEDLPETRAHALGLDATVDIARWKQFLTSVDRKVRTDSGGASAPRPFPERFYFPLRDWEHYPLVEALPPSQRAGAQARIRLATTQYIRAVDNLARAGVVDDAAIKELLVLNAKWGHDTGLSDIFDRFRQTAPPPETGTQAIESLAMPKTQARFPTGRPYTEITMNRREAHSPEYRHFLENSVEVIYDPRSEYGHIRLRVGQRLYSFSGIRNTKNSEFNPNQVDRSNTGVVFTMSKEKIASIESYLKAFYGNSTSANVPPFDIYSDILEVVPTDHGLKYVRKGAPAPEARELKGTIVTHEGKSYLQTADGFQYPLTKQGGRYFVQSLACSTSASCVLDSQLGVSVPFGLGARDLIRALLSGNSGGTRPNAVINYGH